MDITKNELAQRLLSAASQAEQWEEVAVSVALIRSAAKMLRSVPRVVCANCNDTGRNPGSNYLDCAAPGCTAAADRVALGEFYGGLPSNTDVIDPVFAIDQRARQQEREACAARVAELEAENAALRQLAGDANAVFALMLDGCREQSFAGYQNGHGEDIGAQIELIRKRLAAAPLPPAAAPAVPSIDDALLDRIAAAHGEDEDPKQFVRNGWGCAGIENVRAALDELMGYVRAATPAPESQPADERLARAVYARVIAVVREHGDKACADYIEKWHPVSKCILYSAREASAPPAPGTFTPGEFVLKSGAVVLIDEQDREEFSKYLWSIDAYGYVIRNLSRKASILMHRVVMGAGKGQIVDHIDGNTMNNRRENLRIASGAQNQANAQKRQGRSSKHKGVSWSKKDKRWRAAISVDGKTLYLGSFIEEDYAGHAYNKAAIQYFGDFARINPIGEDYPAAPVSTEADHG